jgi:hypothetical protein
MKLLQPIEAEKRSGDAAHEANFPELRQREVRRRLLPHTPVNKGGLLDRLGAFSMVQG